MCMCETIIIKELAMNLKGNRRYIGDVEDIIILEILLNFRVNTALTASVEQNKDLDINPSHLIFDRLQKCLVEKE